jgi:hypothetical protein
VEKNSLTDFTVKNFAFAFAHWQFGTVHDATRRHIDSFPPFRSRLSVECLQ